MKRRAFIAHLIALTAGASLAGRSLAGDPEPPKEKIVRTEAEWKKLLTPEQYHILREEGTERAFTSPLDREYRKGTYVCAGCELPLFTSEMKFNSGHGLAELLHQPARQPGDQEGLQAGLAAHRVPLRPLRWPSGPRLRLRSQAHRTALVQQRAGPALHPRSRGLSSTRVSEGSEAGALGRGRCPGND